MTDLRKAAEQALEALQYTCDYLPAKTGVDRDVDDAITALRQALAQPDLAKVGEVGVWGHKREWVGLTVNEARDFYEKYTNREELIYAIDKFLEEKNA